MINRNKLELLYSKNNFTKKVLNPEKLAEVQNRTYTDMITTLIRYGECNLERPMGFGKTKLFIQLADAYPQERVLYIYDVNTVVDDIRHKYHPKNVTFVSYTMLSKVDSRDVIVQQIVNAKYFLVIFDESHLMGGENIRQTIDTFLPMLKEQGCLRLGGTATPMRTDGHNVTEEFFGGHRVYAYNIDNAIDDGIMLEPYYCLILGTLQRIDKVRKKNEDNAYTVERLNQLEQAYADRIGAPKIYHDVILEVNNGRLPAYMRFLVFYPTIKALTDNAEKVCDDLRKAFPDYGVGLTMVSSDVEHEKVVSHLDATVADNTIDVIASVDMLNQAYHSHYLTGVIMLRQTWSNIIFTQQYGRACNVASLHRVAVFDNVGNALMDPLEVIAKDFGDGEPYDDGAGGESGKGGWTWGRKNSRHMVFHVSAEQLELERALQRVRVTAGVTKEFKEKAKKLMGPLFNAPDDAVVKMTRLPLWFVEELRSEMEQDKN